MAAVSLPLADNPAVLQLVEQIVILRALVNAMAQVAHEREAEIERLLDRLDELRFGEAQP